MEENITTTINLNEIVIKDLNENILPINDMAKTLGNVLFVNADSIEISDIARELHKGESLELTQDELKDITTVLAQHVYFKPWVHQQVIRYFTDKVTFENTQGA